MSFDTIACGAAFGAALAASAVHQPHVIVSQLSLTNFHMLESFLTAVASSALFTAVVQSTGYAAFPPRSFSSLGGLPFVGTGLGGLDGNVVGGLLQGAGMALAGACAGTVFAQNGAGIRSSFYALGGALVGGIVWSGFLRPTVLLRRRWQQEQQQQQQQQQSSPEKAPLLPPSKNKLITVDQQLGLGPRTTLLLLEAMFVAVIGVAASSMTTTTATTTTTTIPATGTNTHGPVHPVTGGLLIGLAQLFSILLRKSMLGTSTSFEEFGDYFWWLVGAATTASSSKKRSPPPPYKNMLFAASMALGSYLVSLRFPVIMARGVQSGLDANSPARVALGGALIAIGSRMAGGCTSGHGISGISLMSISSFVTLAAIFAGGIGVTSAIDSQDWRQLFI